MKKAAVIGGGLAGCECAWQLQKYGIQVTLIDQKPGVKSPAHISDSLCELVCSNSLRSDELSNASGLLKQEMRNLGSLIMEAADHTKVPAGAALAVDREGFSRYVQNKLLSSPLIKIVEEEITDISGMDNLVVATGPLTSPALLSNLTDILGDGGLNFFDAVAPTVSFESIDMQKAYFGSRYGKAGEDYINCPMEKDEYEAFYEALISAESAEINDFEESMVFEGCMPVEEMAKRGKDTLRFGPLKPVGLLDPRTGRSAYAVVQLRRDNKEGSIYNMVGFQTHLKFPEQRRVFRMIPGLENAEFLRYGVMHKNTYINSPKLIAENYRLKGGKKIYFAGQITGVEGYLESASSGLVCGQSLARELLGLEKVVFPRCTAIGALAYYVMDDSIKNFQPMNINFGIMECKRDKKIKGKRLRNEYVSNLSLMLIDEYIDMYNIRVK